MTNQRSIQGHSPRVLSGMRTTGKLHLGHYHGVLKNWVKLQNEYESFFFAADWHALTTHYESPQVIDESIWEMFIDWMAAGIDPAQSTLFIQSLVPEHAELHLLLSMITPMSWLERVPTYKEQQEKLNNRDLSTYGFLGYPLLQSADILIYRTSLVPVGEDQLPHLELTREVARRFNFLYGREAGYEEKAELAIDKMGKKSAKLYRNYRSAYQQNGDEEALNQGKNLLAQQRNLTIGDKERLFGYLEGGGRVILPEPEALLTEVSKMPGLDGQKMSKSYNNTIYLRDDNARVEKAIKAMPTDPQRVRRTDAGNPEKCPVWDFHKVYSGEEEKKWVVEGCKTAGIGCIDCKGVLLQGLLKEQDEIKERAKPYVEDPALVRNIIANGTEKARDAAKETMSEVRHIIGMNF